MNTKEQWEEDIQKRVNDIAYSHPKSGKEATENRNKILEIIRETREQAKKEERERIKKAIKFVTITPFDDNNRKLADALELLYQRDINPEILKLL